jgi:hypothetical protein
MEHKLISKFLDEVKLLYPSNIVYLDHHYKSDVTNLIPIGPILIIDLGHSSYEIELSSLHYTDSEGDLVIEQCKQIFLQYRRQHMLQQLV